MKTEVKSTCCYCGVGCGILIETDDGAITGLRGDPDHPANRGRLCTKGATLNQTADTTYRLQFPEKRMLRGQPGERQTWDQALDEAADRFAATIRQYGPDSVAFYISGQLMTEDYYVFNKLAKGLIGTNNVDTNSRLCMSSAVAGYKQTLGADAPPCSYADILQAKVIFIAGANPAVAHPIVFRYVEDAKAANPDLKIIVADPRRSESATGRRRPWCAGAPRPSTSAPAGRPGAPARPPASRRCRWPSAGLRPTARPGPHRGRPCHHSRSHSELCYQSQGRRTRQQSRGHP